MRRRVQKIKILGYPFAGGQGKCGVELTPSWLTSQSWFTDLTRRSNGHIQYEEILVSNPHSNNLASQQHDENDESAPKNIENVLRSAMSLRNQTYNALRQGFYPIVLGGDHSQAIGSIAGLKKMYPEAKLLWLDAHIDANTPETSPSKNMHGMPLAYLSGMIPHHSQWKCIDMSKDICYFGIRSYEPEEHQLLKEKNVLVFESSECLKENIHFIKQELYSYFKRQSNKYWISFDIDSVDATSFESTGTAEEEGLTLDFVENFFSSFAHKTVGMDFTEVNFELAPSAHQRLNDENTFRHLLELILHSVNDPQTYDDYLHIPTFLEPNMQTFGSHGLNDSILNPTTSQRQYSVKNKIDK